MSFLIKKDNSDQVDRRSIMTNFKHVSMSLLKIYNNNTNRSCGRLGTTN